MNSAFQHALCLAGATAVGKSAVALVLAERLNGEIIAVDSMQVYRGLDVGTAKPTLAEQQRVPHHLLDVAALDQDFDAARFVRLARFALEDITARGNLPILCGGTGLYFKALWAGLGEGPSGDPELRAQLEATPLAELLEELAKRDPGTYARIDRHNPRRVVRALEVVRLTGQPVGTTRADWVAETTLSRFQNVPTFFGLERDSADLRARIDARVEAMFAGGLVEETQRLLEQGLAQNRTALQAIGYRQVVEHLRGERSLPDTIALVKQRTWQLARRQRTWFRHQLVVDWVSVGPGESPKAVANRIEQRFRG